MEWQLCVIDTIYILYNIRDSSSNGIGTAKDKAKIEKEIEEKRMSGSMGVGDEEEEEEEKEIYLKGSRDAGEQVWPRLLLYFEWSCSPRRIFHLLRLRGGRA